MEPPKSVPAVSRRTHGIPIVSEYNALAAARLYAAADSGQMLLYQDGESALRLHYLGEPTDRRIAPNITAWRRVIAGPKGEWIAAYTLGHSQSLFLGRADTAKLDLIEFAPARVVDFLLTTDELIVSTTLGQILSIDLLDRKTTSLWQSDTPVECAALAVSDCQRWLAWSTPHKTMVFRRDEGRIVLRTRTVGNAWTSSFSPDGSMLLSGGKFDKTCVVTSIDTGKLVCSTQVGASPTCALWSPDQRMVCVGTGSLSKFKEADSRRLTFIAIPSGKIVAKDATDDYAISQLIAIDDKSGLAVNSKKVMAWSWPDEAR